MWSASWPGSDVILRRDDETFALISVDDWWVMSATRYLADEALREEGLDFKLSEIYGPETTDVPVWTTNMVANGDTHDVHLLRHGVTLAVMSLDEYAGLSITEYIVDDAVQVAGGLSEYGSNIEEVDEALKHEEGIEAEERLDELNVSPPKQRDQPL